MVDAVISMSEYSRFSKGIFGYVGFKTEFIPYVAERREVGKTKWSRGKLTRYALDGIFSFSTAPLKLSTFVGLLSAFASLVYLIIVLIQKLAFGIDIPGYATIVVLILFLGGAQLFCLGIIGEYIAKIFLQVKGRPIYVLRQKLDTDPHENENSQQEETKLDA
jgi:glycosyltransferase involved in cell wall biosynthesis